MVLTVVTTQTGVDVLFAINDALKRLVGTHVDHFTLTEYQERYVRGGQ